MKGRPLPHPLPERRGEIIRAERGILPSSLPKRGEVFFSLNPCPSSPLLPPPTASPQTPPQRGRGKPHPLPLKPPPTSPRRGRFTPLLRGGDCVFMEQSSEGSGSDNQ